MDPSLTPRIAVSLQLTVLANIKITIRGTTAYLFTTLLPNSKKKEYELKVKNFCKIQMQVGIGLQKVQKQGRDENTKRLSCCRKVGVKKDWKTTLHMLHSQAQEVE